VLARARLFEGRLPREGIPGRENVVLFTGGGVEAVLAAPTGSLGKGESQRTSGLSEGGDRDVRGSVTGYVAGREGPPFQRLVIHRSDQGVVKRQDPRARWIGSWKRQKRDWAIDELPAAKAAVTNREPTRRECSQ
jgi:hypothetical protein